MKWLRSLALAFALLAMCSSTALADAISLGAPLFDANKPFPVAANDLSCWIASAANMLAADEWDGGNVADIYAQLEANPAFKNGTGWRGGFQSEALNYALVNFVGMSGYDGTEKLEMINSWRKPWTETDTQKALLDILLNQTTAPEDGGNPPAADDPVGIAFHYDGPGQKIAHAVTAWGERVLPDGTRQLGITDSDDGPAAALQWFNWVVGSESQISYYGRNVTIDYMVALREGDDFGLPAGDFVENIGDLADGPPDLPAPEPGSLVLLGTGLLAFARFGRRRLRKS